ncbi:hypothetical protein KCU74_g2, partial [Aureobasidium melanogenum]
MGHSHVQLALRKSFALHGQFAHCGMQLVISCSGLLILAWHTRVWIISMIRCSFFWTGNICRFDDSGCITVVDGL